MCSVSFYSSLVCAKSGAWLRFSHFYTRCRYDPRLSSLLFWLVFGLLVFEWASFCIILLSFIFLLFLPPIPPCVCLYVCVWCGPLFWCTCFSPLACPSPPSGQPVSPGQGYPNTSSAPTTPADTSATQNAPPSSPPPPPPPPPPLPPLPLSTPQPGLQSQAPSLPPALLRPPLPSLPYLLSPSCLSYSLLSASLGATRSVVMPTNTPAFSPIIATPSPVKNDVPIVQDAAGTYPNQHCSCHSHLLNPVQSFNSLLFLLLFFLFIFLSESVKGLCALTISMHVILILGL